MVIHPMNDTQPEAGADRPATISGDAFAPREVIDFRLALFTQTPRAWVTPLLLGLNVAVFAVMVLSGVSLMSPTSESLLRWGADFGPYVTSGQLWRLLTNTFIHVGLVHLVMNMIGLWQIGLLVERLLGNAGYLVMYLLAGLAGSLMSMAVHPFTVSAGASGAIFGIYGALIAFLLRHRGSVPRQALSALRTTAIAFIGFNLFYGLRVKGIDMAAHSGGFLGGALVGLVLAAPLGRPVARAGRQAIVTGAIGLVLVLGATRLLPQTTDLSAEVPVFTVIEDHALQLYNDTLKRVDAAQVDDAEAARIIKDQVLPPWHAYRLRFAARKRLRPEQEQFAQRFSKYLRLREEAWTAAADAFIRHDHAAVSKIESDLATQADGLGMQKAEKEPEAGSSSAQHPRGESPVTSP
jgi:rhomboid protease GluP